MRIIEEIKIKGDDVNLDAAVLVDDNIQGANGTLFLTFHWTIGFWQWLFNFCFWPFLFRRPYRDMPEKYFVCWWFFKRYKNIQDPLYRFINKHLKVINNAEIVGYSLGGACAIFAAEDISYKYSRPVYCETMGAPRIVDKKGAEIYKKKNIPIMNWEYGSDIVCKFPPFYKKPGSVIPVPGSTIRDWWDIKGMIDDHSQYDKTRGN